MLMLPTLVCPVSPLEREASSRSLRQRTCRALNREASQELRMYFLFCVTRRKKMKSQGFTAVAGALPCGFVWREASGILDVTSSLAGGDVLPQCRSDPGLVAAPPLSPLTAAFGALRGAAPAGPPSSAGMETGPEGTGVSRGSAREAGPGAACKLVSPHVAVGVSWWLRL